MSYPQPRYRGEGGEVSATYRSADQPPDWTYSTGNTVHYLATGATTNAYPKRFVTTSPTPLSSTSEKLLYAAM